MAVRGTRHRAREELSRAELVSTVAHELRSPLTSVKGFTATLLAKWDRFNDDQKRLMLETVNADADRVTRLITELLDIARIDSGRLTVRRQVVDIGKVVTRHVAAMAARGEDPDAVRRARRRRHPRDVGRRGQARPGPRQPARERGPARRRHGDHRGRAGGSTGPAHRSTVTDEGEGIPDEQRDRVFTRFWRSGRRGGTGLGLYIVRGLVEAHGGQIEVGSGPGGGARFRFVLPAAHPRLPGLTGQVRRSPRWW